jgi:hypothetical protein
LKSSSYDDHHEFQKELNAIVVKKYFPFAIIRPRDKEACDLIVKVFRKNKNCLYYCIDCKSDIELKYNNNNNNNSKNNSKNNCRIENKSLKDAQPQRYHQIKKSMKEMENINVENDLCYIYLTSHATVSDTIEYDNDGCIVVGRGNAASFFGLAWPFYKTCRAAVGKIKKK